MQAPVELSGLKLTAKGKSSAGPRRRFDSPTSPQQSVEAKAQHPPLGTARPPQVVIENCAQSDDALDEVGTNLQNDTRALATGLTADEAYTLAVWLKESACTHIEIITEDAPHFCVRWQR